MGKSFRADNHPSKKKGRKNNGNFIVHRSVHSPKRATNWTFTALTLITSYIPAYWGTRWQYKSNKFWSPEKNERKFWDSETKTYISQKSWDFLHSLFTVCESKSLAPRPSTPPQNFNGVLCRRAGDGHITWAYSAERNRMGLRMLPRLQIARTTQSSTRRRITRSDAPWNRPRRLLLVLLL